MVSPGPEALDRKREMVHAASRYLKLSMGKPTLIEREEALKIAQSSLDASCKHPDLTARVTELREWPHAWVACYQADIETGDPRSRLVGNAPMLIEKEGGSRHFTCAAFPIEGYMHHYETARSRGLPPQQSHGAALNGCITSVSAAKPKGWRSENPEKSESPPASPRAFLGQSNEVG